MDDSWEKTFHRSRKMFAIKDNTLYVNTRETDKSHSEWFREMGWTRNGDTDAEILGAVLRGYVDSTGVYAYRGIEFGAFSSDEALLLRHLPPLAKELGIPHDMPVHLGLIKGQIGEKFKPDKLMGMIKEAQHVRSRARNRTVPEYCYSTNEVTGETIMIKRGEMGYNLLGWPHKTTPAEELNAEIGVTKAQEMAMKTGSMFGWHAPAADPKEWEGKV